jgi:hypothetical protein
VSWRVVHADHNGVPFGEVNPMGLEFGIALSQVNFCNYDISLTNPMASYGYCRPYITDFYLYRDNLLIMAGIHTEIQPDLDTRLLKVSAKEWLHYLEKRIYPFDPANPTANLVTYFQNDAFVVVELILDAVLALSNSLPLNYDNGTSGLLVNWRNDPGDTNSIYDIIKDLGDASPGFDFEVSPDKEFLMYAPRKAISTGFTMQAGRNILNLSYVDSGPDYNHLLGLGQGTTSRLGVVKEDSGSRTTYRRLDGSVDYGDVTAETLDRQAEGDISRGAQSIVKLSGTIVPTESDNFWANVQPGYIINVVADTEYVQINDQFRVLSFAARVTDQGDEQIEVALTDAESGT